MKKLFIILLFALAVFASYGQRYASVFVVPADITVFGKTLPIGTVIVDQQKHATWITTAVSTSAMTLLTATAVPMLADSSTSAGLFALSAGTLIPTDSSNYLWVTKVSGDTLVAPMGYITTLYNTTLVTNDVITEALHINDTMFFGGADSSRIYDDGMTLVISNGGKLSSDRNAMIELENSGAYLESRNHYIYVKNDWAFGVDDILLYGDVGISDTARIGRYLFIQNGISLTRTLITGDSADFSQLDATEFDVDNMRATSVTATYLINNKITTATYSDTLAYGDSIVLCSATMAPNVWVSVDTIGIPIGKADLVIGSNGTLAQVYTPYGCIVVGSLVANKICIRKWGTSVYIRNNRWKHQRISYEIKTL